MSQNNSAMWKSTVNQKCTIKKQQFLQMSTTYCLFKNLFNSIFSPLLATPCKTTRSWLWDNTTMQRSCKVHSSLHCWPRKRFLPFLPSSVLPQQEKDLKDGFSHHWRKFQKKKKKNHGWRVLSCYSHLLSTCPLLCLPACCNYTVRAKVTMRISTCFHVGGPGGIDLLHVCLIAFEQTRTWENIFTAVGRVCSHTTDTCERFLSLTAHISIY